MPAKRTRFRQKLAHERHAFVERWRGLFDANAIGTGETDAAVALHEQNQLAGVEGRLLHELKRRPFPSGVDFDDAFFLREQTQPMASDQRLHRLGRGSETIDQLFAQQIEIIVRIGDDEIFDVVPVALAIGFRFVAAARDVIESECSVRCGHCGA